MHPSSDRPGAVRQIDNELAAEGYVNERGKPINPKSIKAVIDGPSPAKGDDAAE
jgi:hypothetical protein